jgi:hypothetical protein
MPMINTCGLHDLLHQKDYQRSASAAVPNQNFWSFVYLRLKVAPNRIPLVAPS